MYDGQPVTIKQARLCHIANVCSRQNLCNSTYDNVYDGVD